MKPFRSLKEDDDDFDSAWKRSSVFSGDHKATKDQLDLITRALELDAHKRATGVTTEDAIEDTPSMTAGSADAVVTDPAKPVAKKGKPFPTATATEGTLRRFSVSEATKLSDQELETRILKVLGKVNPITADQVAEKVSYKLPWSSPDETDALHLEVSYALARMADAGKIARETSRPGKVRYLRKTMSEAYVGGSAAEKNPFHKVLMRHGFVLSQSNPNTVSKFSKKTVYDEFVYTHPNHGRSVVIITMYHGPSGVYGTTKSWFFRYEQPNGIMAPTSGDTVPQLDRALSRDLKEAYLHESEHTVTASELGFKPLKGAKNQKFAFPESLSHGGRSWNKETSGGERWQDDALAAVTYRDSYGNILKVMNEAYKLVTRVARITIAKGLSKEDAEDQARNYQQATGKAVDVLKEVTEETVPDAPTKCIYCSDHKVDPKHAPYCSARCAAQAQHD